MDGQKKTPQVAAGEVQKNKQSSPKFTDISTTAEAQQLRIVTALRSGPKTTDDLRALGCYQVSARVFGLRALGYNIITDLFDGYAADGFSHTRMARYTLVGEPEGGAT
ncbi:helix-turn-helix domain-containing protein [Variovorax sp. RT4R15]|uniref:helix-turn-helix domain-containing protein n=1 Tax=Variovorax sp. RT4R15 TaxID=3443737 RepID=UPI003F483F9C